MIPRAPQTATPKGNLPLRTLLAEDSPVMAEVLSRLLAELPGIEFLGHVKDGGEAIQKVAELLPDVVIMDIQMPGMNGLDATREIRRTFPSVSVLLTSAHQAKLEEAGLREPQIRFIRKSRLPFDLEQALNSLKQLDRAPSGPLDSQTNTQGRPDCEANPEWQLFREILAATTMVPEVSFFESLVQNLAEALGVKHALISEVYDERLERARTVALWSNQQLAGNFEYTLEGTPCENVALGKLCFCENRIQEHFPKDLLLQEMGCVSYAGIPLRNAKGAVIGILAALDDRPMVQSAKALAIFEIFAIRAGLELDRLLMERQLSSSEAYFRSLVEGGSDVILVLDRDGRVRYASPSCARATGYTLDEVRGQLIFDVVHPADSSSLLQTLCAAFDAASPGPLFECRIRCKDGVWRHFEARANALVQDGCAREVVVNCRDITERIRMHEELCHRQRMETIGMASSGIAHDFKNVLSPILMNADIATLDLDPYHPVQEQIRDIKAAALRGAALAKQILQFSSNQGVPRNRAAVPDIVKEALTMLRASIPKTVLIQHKLAENLPQIIVDITQIHQVLLNLGINAWHATEGVGRAGIIEISASPLDGPATSVHPDLTAARYVCLNVSDNGRGIEPELIHRIFEPFFTTKALGKGTGLGLSVVSNIVKAHGGVVTVSSLLGHGTQFSIYLPAV